MTMRSTCAAFSLLALAACLGSNPPGPPVRWFDPSPVRTAADARPPVRVQGSPFLRQDFVVRRPPHELAIDDSLRWVAPPEQLVGSALAVANGLPADLELEVVRFEFEDRGGIFAVVELGCRSNRRTTPVRVDHAASSSRPEDLAAAMASALAELPRAVATALGGS